MAWTTRTFSAGTTLLAAWLNEFRDNFKAIGDPWTSWTPTFSGGISAIGNATVVAKYRQAGKDVTGEVKVTMGSTTTFAAAVISITSPVTFATHTNRGCGSAVCLDASAGLFYTPNVIAASSTTFALVQNATGGVSNTVPFTWTTSDILSFEFSFEAA